MVLNEIFAFRPRDRYPLYLPALVLKRIKTYPSAAIHASGDTLSAVEGVAGMPIVSHVVDTKLAVSSEQVINV